MWGILNEFYLLNDKRVDTLLLHCEKAALDGQRSTSGHAFSNLTQECLKLAIFAMKHFKHVFCKINLETLTKKDIIAFSQQR